MKYLILVLLSIMTISSSAQSDVSSNLNRIEEIKQYTDPVARDSQLIWQYSYVSEELARYKDSRTEAYLDTLEAMARVSDWDMAMGLFYRAMGRYHEFSGNYKPVLDYYQRAIEELKNSSGDLKELAFTYVLKGFFLSNSELYQECWTTLEEGLPYAYKAKSKNSLCLMLDWFGDYYYYGLDGETDYGKALDYYLQVNSILPQISYKMIIADNHVVLAGVYGRLNNDLKSEFHFQIADSLTQEWNLPHTRWGLLSDKATTLEENGQYKEANTVYLEAKDVMATSTNLEFKSRLERALWQNYKSLGNYEKSLEHYERMTEMESKMAIENIKNEYLEIESKYNLALKENEIQALQKKSLRSNRNLLITLLLISLISGALIWRNNKALSKANSDLEKSKNEIQEAIYKGETQERRRIASELHDNVNTTLAAARWRLEAIIDNLKNPTKDIVSSTISMMNQAYQDVRNISHNLVPDELENEGLIDSIENLLIKINESSRVMFSIESNIKDTSILKNISYPIYNIIYELINNVLKHADANKSHISILKEGQEILLIISDNGQGYDAAKIREGFGLRSILSRVESMGGVLNITSAEGKGCTTKIKIPLQHQLT